MDYVYYERQYLYKFTNFKKARSIGPQTAEVNFLASLIWGVDRVKCDSGRWMPLINSLSEKTSRQGLTLATPHFSLSLWGVDNDVKIAVDSAP